MTRRFPDGTPLYAISNSYLLFLKERGCTGLNYTGKFWPIEGLLLLTKEGDIIEVPQPAEFVTAS